MSKFLVMNMLRDVKNGKLNGNKAANEINSGLYDNQVFTKKIKRGRSTLPYASGQWIKRNIKDFAISQGVKNSEVITVDSSQALTEGDPYNNYDEDVMGFMNATKLVIPKEDWDELDEIEQKLWKKGKKGKMEKNITKRRRQKLMVSTLQAIGNTLINPEFSTRKTEDTPLLYTKEVYSTLMSNSAILAKHEVGKYKISENETGFRDYTEEELELLDIDIEDGCTQIQQESDIINDRIKTTIKGLQYLPTRINSANNLEDLSAKFVIMADYSIGNSVFNNIFEDNELKIEYLKEAIEENEEYRDSKIYIGCRSEFMKHGELWLRDIIEKEFGDNDKIVIGGVGEVIDQYIVDVL